jgi:hypothetical protein
MFVDAVGGSIGEHSRTCPAEHGRIVVCGLSSMRLTLCAGSQMMDRNQSMTGNWLTGRLRPHGGADHAAAAFYDAPHAFSPETGDRRAISSRRTVSTVVLTAWQPRRTRTPAPT